MIAEIKGKVNMQNTNLTSLREDELTGNFFGNLRYIPFAKGLKKVLRNAIRPTALQSMIDEQETTEVGCHFCSKKYLFTRDDLRRLIR